MRSPLALDRTADRVAVLVVASLAFVQVAARPTGRGGRRLAGREQEAS